MHWFIKRGAFTIRVLIYTEMCFSSFICICLLYTHHIYIYLYIFTHFHTHNIGRVHIYIKLKLRIQGFNPAFSLPIQSKTHTYRHYGLHENTTLVSLKHQIKLGALKRLSNTGKILKVTKLYSNLRLHVCYIVHMLVKRSLFRCTGNNVYCIATFHMSI